MQSLPVTSLFAAVYAIVFVLLSIQVIRQRTATRTAFGDGNDSKLKHYISAHANFAQYVPFFILISALNEMAGMQGNLLYVLNFIMLYGRISHAYGISVHELNHSDDGNVLRFRKTGMMATFAAISLGALLLLSTTLR